MALWILLASASLALIMLLSGFVPAVIDTLTDDGYAEFFTNILAVLATVIGLSIAGLLTTEQLDLKRVDRSKDRRLSAKRDVLMDVIRGMHKMIGQIPRLASIEIEQNEISKVFGEGLSQASPGWSVADLPTVALMQRIVNETNLEFIELSKERWPLVKLSDESRTLDKVLDSSNLDNKRLFRRQTDATGAGREDEAKRWSGLYRISVSAMPSIRDDRDKVRAELDQLHVPYMLKCVFIHRRLRTDFRKLQARIRAEIEVDGEMIDGYPAFNHAADLQDKRFVRHMRQNFPDHHELILQLARQAGCDMGDE